MFASNRSTSSNTGATDWRQMNTRPLMSDPVDYTGGLSVSTGSPQMMAKQIVALKQDNTNLQAAVYELQSTGDKLRSTIRKMKVENGRFKLKLKRVSEVAKARGDITDFDELTETADFKDVKDFLLIGGNKDPLDCQYVASIKDVSGREFKTGERYLWYKMAEHFGDVDSAKQLLATDDPKKAQEIVDKVKNFDQASWDSVKLKHFEEYQRMKFDQNRQLRCLLLKTAPIYLAIASQDKIYGTGWRKQRLESDRTQLWDGENLGGKVLMKLRDEYSANHSWLSSTEEQEAKKAFDGNKRTVWRRTRQQQNGGAAGGMLGKRGRGGGPNSQNRMTSGASFFDSYPGSYYGAIEGYTSFSTPSTVTGYGRNGGAPSYSNGMGGFKRRR